ncbi:MAG: TonB-dependent receptor, partial [Candidatus Solibacter sp.]|nr:TonB-dependent receptor [Candidatus Solibacter sp.]
MIAANPGVQIDALRPYKGYNSIRMSDNVSRSMYHSLQLSWNKRYSHGFTGGVSYTLSKSMDFGSAQRDIIPNTYNAADMYGQSDFDVRHIFIANYSYDLPFFRNATKLSGKMLGGWQISGITQSQTGTTCGVATSNDYAG